MAGAGTAEKNRFDREDRERIRDALIAYMEARSIGVPTLQKEIAIANGLTLDRIPLSTLQRFLSSTHRTNDAFVRFCHSFAASLPVSDAPGRLAGELGLFYAAGDAGRSDAAEGAQALLPPRLQGFASEALLRKGQADVVQVGRTKIVKMGADRASILYSELERSGTRQTNAVTERVFNWALSGDKADDPDVCRAYEGAAVVSGSSAFFVLRNLLTRAPRTYVLTIGDDGVMAGRSAEPVGVFEMPRSSGTVESVAVRFVPAEAGA
ncbi:hypothetical protein [Salinarimonas rosea]|uniref:hypothetical protein n=1 Tax=Salinarimonas rosea TaxID=552063 RepID=UPI00048EE0FE|nr:hypothetical protein [Salinarimonas rosea]